MSVETQLWLGGLIGTVTGLAIGVGVLAVWFLVQGWRKR